MIALLLIVWMSCEYPHHDTGRHRQCVISLPDVGAIVLTVRCASSKLILFEDLGTEEAFAESISRAEQASDFRQT